MSSSSSIDWEKIKKDISESGATIYPLEECSFRKQIGNGRRMDVFEGQCNIKMSIKNVALKRHKGFNMSSRLKQSDVNQILDHFRHEIALMNKLKYHSNVVQIYGVTFKERIPILIVELGNETLDRYLLNMVELGKPVSWIEKARLSLDVLKGMNELHDAGIIHGDIEGGNILVFIEPTGIAIAKISDFGFFSTLTSTMGNSSRTQYFMAPEVMGIYPELEPWHNERTKDIFSFGLVTYQIAAHGKRPYENFHDVFNAKTTDRDMKTLLANLPHDTPDQFRTIIINTTKFIPTDRAPISLIEWLFWDFLNGPQLQQSASIVSQESTIKLIPEIVTPPIADTWRVQARKRLEEYTRKVGFEFDKNDISDHYINGKRTPLFWSAYEGDIDVIMLLVDEYKVDVNTKYKSGWTPLFYAVMGGHIEVVKMLVAELKMDTSAQISTGHTVLHFAAQNGHIEIVKLLLTEYKVNARAQTKAGAIPLHLATEKGHIEVVRLLMAEHKVNANAQDHLGRTPLHLAAQNRYIEIVRLLVTDYKVDTSIQDENGSTPLHLAAIGGHTEVVRLLTTGYKMDASIKDSSGKTPLHKVAEKGYPNVVNIPKSIEVYSESAPPPQQSVKVVNQMAAVKPMPKVVAPSISNTWRVQARERLKEYAGKIKFNLDKNDINNHYFDGKRKLLIWSAIKGDTEVIRILVEEYKADIRSKSEDGWTALHSAAGNGRVEVVRLLVTEYDVNANVQDKFGFTPLHSAAANGHIEVVKHLVTKCSVDANAKDTSGKTSLHHATEKGHSKVVGFLDSWWHIQGRKRLYEYAEKIGFGLHDFNKNDTNSYYLEGKRKLLIWSVIEGDIEAIRILLNDYKVGIEEKDDYGLTPLHHAAIYGLAEVARLLITEHKADVNTQSMNGSTPLHSAARRGHLEVVRLLVSEYKVNANTQIDSGHTPLHLAARDGHIEVVRFLASEYKVDANIQDEDGFTPLHSATQNGHIEIIRLLVIEYKVDVRVTDRFGKKALYYARKRGYSKAEELLSM